MFSKTRMGEQNTGYTHHTQYRYGMKYRYIKMWRKLKDIFSDISPIYDGRYSLKYYKATRVSNSGRMVATRVCGRMTIDI